MKNKIRIAFWAIFLNLCFSCTSLITIFPHHDKTDVEFETYLEKIPVETGDLIIGFKEASGFLDSQFTKGSTIAGFCGVSLFPPTAQISINPTWWKNKSEKQRLALLVHEIGHCKYAKLHNDDKIFFGCPKTLMNSFTTSKGCLDMYWDYYMWEIKRRFDER